MNVAELRSKLPTLNLLEQARAMRETLPEGVSLREAGRLLARDKRWIDRRFRLLKMDPAIQGLAERGVLGEYILEEISRLPEEEQLAAADKAVRAREKPERKPRHKTEEQVRDMLVKLLEADADPALRLLCCWFVGKATDGDIENEIQKQESGSKAD